MGGVVIDVQHNTVSVTSIIGGVSDNTGSGIARRIGKLYTMELNCIKLHVLLALFEPQVLLAIYMSAFC